MAFDVDSSGQSTVPGSPAGGFLPALPGSKIEFSIKTDTLPEVRIAEALTIPAGATSIDLALDDQQIASYAKSDSFSITTKASGTTPSQNTTLEADQTLHIEANVL